MSREQQSISAPELIFDFVDTGLPHKSNTFSKLVGEAVAWSIDDVKPALRAVQKATESGLWAAGFVSYEASAAFNQHHHGSESHVMPLVWFGFYQSVEQTVEKLQISDYHIGEWTSPTSRAKYSDDIDSIKDSIEHGATYQANYTMRLRAEFAGNDFALYRELRRRQQSQYCAYLNIGRHRILSASPELFFRKSGNKIVTKPMKGTSPRGLWFEDDQSMRTALSLSKKDQAENVMIVDLLRNDLGKIADTGSVVVTKLFEIEQYPTAYQMTSTVEASVRDDAGLEEIFEALFPCGSITGAPKIKTMQIIAQLENEPREIYTGAIGYVSPGQKEMAFNVAIRTVWIDSESGIAEYGTGGAITWDSKYCQEYSEALTKAEILHAAMPDFDLIETCKAQDGKVWLLERHLTRLQRSAYCFGYQADIDFARQLLLDSAAKAGHGEHKLRLLLAVTGNATVTSSPLQRSTTTVSVCLASSPIDLSNRFLYHKTTYREFYNKLKSPGTGIFDVLLWNQRREITEFTIGNVVVDFDDVLYTPPVKCGLLPGTFREELIAAGTIFERLITVDELSKAKRIWLINSVQGWVEVELKPQQPEIIAERSISLVG